jgi:hypothetical protein
MYNPKTPNCTTCAMYLICPLPTQYSEAMMLQILVMAALTGKNLTPLEKLAEADKAIDSDRTEGKENTLLNQVQNEFHEVFEKEHPDLVTDLVSIPKG